MYHNYIWEHSTIDQDVIMQIDYIECVKLWNKYIKTKINWNVSLSSSVCWWLLSLTYLLTYIAAEHVVHRNNYEHTTFSRICWILLVAWCFYQIVVRPRLVSLDFWQSTSLLLILHSKRAFSVMTYVLSVAPSVERVAVKLNWVGECASVVWRYCRSVVGKSVAAQLLLSDEPDFVDTHPSVLMWYDLLWSSVDWSTTHFCHIFSPGGGWTGTVAPIFSSFNSFADLLWCLALRSFSWIIRSRSSSSSLGVRCLCLSKFDVVGSSVFVRRLNNLCAGDVFTPWVGLFLKSSSAKYGSVFANLLLVISRLMVWIASSTLPLLDENVGELVRCSNFHSLLKCLKASQSNCLPLSL